MLSGVIDRRGIIVIPKEAIEDDVPLPMLPSSLICKGAKLEGRYINRRTYTILFIKEQPFY